AVEDDYLEKNQFTMEYIKHNEESKDMQVWTPYEFHKFISVVEDKSDALVFQLLYWTGMRKGELMALKFENIDLEKNEIHIRHNYDYRNHMLTSPKTTNSSRDITMTKQLKKLLEEYINHYSGLACFSKNNFLIGIDKPLSTTTLERKKNYYCKLAGVNKIRIHDFRHSHVSLLIDMKQQVFTIAKRLGHSPDMVNNTYGHLFKEAQIRMADDLSALIDEYAY
ncbi:MAG: site-specific integrase, partial [Erysipelotrichaceae bacterium]